MVHSTLVSFGTRGAVRCFAMRCGIGAFAAGRRSGAVETIEPPVAERDTVVSYETMRRCCKVFAARLADAGNAAGPAGQSPHAMLRS